MKNRKCLVLMLVGALSCGVIACGGSTRPKTNTKNDFNFESNLTWGSSEEDKETDTEGAAVVGENHVNTGEVQYGPDGTVSLWRQYGYAEDGSLSFDRQHYAYGDYYTETTYNAQGQKTSSLDYDGSGNITYGYYYEYDEQGNLTKEKNFDENESAFDLVYSYEYDASGKPIVRKEARGEGNQPHSITNYIYDDAGNLQKTTTQNKDGLIFQENFYDEQEKVVAEITYNLDSAVSAYQYYEYDEYGDLIRIRYDDLNFEVGEEEIHYVYSYDDAGNRISVTTYDGWGNKLGKKLNAYGEVAEEYTLETMQEQAEKTEDRLYAASGNEEKYFAMIKEKIEKDETAFTFGFWSSRFVQIKDMAVKEFSRDEEGRYCDIDITYSSEQGDKTYTRRTYYVIDGGGCVQLTKCSVDVPDEKFEVPKEEFCLWNGAYYRTTFNTSSGVRELVVDRSNALHFTQSADDYMIQEYVGTCEVRTGSQPDTMVLRRGEFTTDYREETQEFDFVLKICWENGLVDKYYCEDLGDPSAIRMNVLDEETEEILSAKLYTQEYVPNYIMERLLYAD